MDECQQLARLTGLLRLHHRLPNRVLLRAQLLILRNPAPTERVFCAELANLWGLEPNNTRNTIRAMVKARVIDVEAFKGDSGGWRFLRIGPPPERPRRPRSIVTDCDSGTPATDYRRWRNTHAPDRRHLYSHLPWLQGELELNRVDRRRVGPGLIREWQEQEACTLFAVHAQLGRHIPICRFETPAECEAAMHEHNAGLTRHLPSHYREALLLACDALHRAAQGLPILEREARQKAMAAHRQASEALSMWP